MRPLLTSPKGGESHPDGALPPWGELGEGLEGELLFTTFHEPLLYVAFQIIGQYLLFINCLLSLT